MSTEEEDSPRTSATVTPEEAIARHKAASKWRVVTAVLAVISIPALLAASVLATVLYMSSQGNVEKLADSNDRQIQQFTDCKTLPKNDPRCQQPVAPPASEITTPPAVIPEDPKPEDPKPTSITVQEVQRIAAAEAAKRSWSLTPAQMNTVVQSAATVAATKIPKPKDGKTPTTAQLTPLVSTALQAFCAGDKCKGEKGEKGDSVKGDKGDPPSTSELTALLTSFCADRNGCVGRDGVSGADGADGIGIANITRVENLLVIRMTDDKEYKFVFPAGPEGPAGPAGPPGPVCPEGWRSEDLTVMVPPTEPEADPVSQKIRTCIPA